MLHFAVCQRLHYLFLLNLITENDLLTYFLFLVQQVGHWPFFECKESGVQALVARSHLEIYFLSRYVRNGWFVGIESGLGSGNLSSIHARAFGFNR